MKRMTVLVDVEVIKQLQEFAKRENCTIAEISRKALNEFVFRRRRKKSRLSLIGIGRSGRKDVAETNEELLDRRSPKARFAPPTQTR